MDEVLSCSLCKSEFFDFVKLIVECGSSLCERCYEDLREKADKEESGRFKCPVCREVHALLHGELPDNKPLLKLIRNLPKKPMPPSARELGKEIDELKEQIEKLHAFDGAQLVELKCEQLEAEVQDAIASAVNHLKKIEAKMLRQIRDYESRCLKNLNARSSEPDDVDEELASLTSDIESFSARWSNYFKHIDVYESESDIEAARMQAAEFSSAIQSMEKRLTEDAYGWKKAVFTLNWKFWENWDHVGDIELVYEQSENYGTTLASGEQSVLEETRASSTDIDVLEENNKIHPGFNFRKKKRKSIGDSPVFVLTRHTAAVNQVLFLPDGRLVSCSDDCTIRIWDVESGRELFKLEGHVDWVYTAIALPDDYLASGCKDGTISYWNLALKREIQSIRGHSDAVLCLGLLKTGNLVSYSIDDTIKLWNIISTALQPVMVLTGHGNISIDIPLFGVISGRYMVTCSTRNDANFVCMLRLWTPNEFTRPVKSISTGLRYARSLLVLSDRLVALGCESERIKIYNGALELLFTFKETDYAGIHHSLAELPDSSLITASWSRSVEIKVWRKSDWKLLQTIDTEHSNRINSLCVSTDKKLLVSGSQDGAIKLWPIIAQQPRTSDEI